MGAQVIASVGADGKFGLVRDLGADSVINYRTEDLVTRVKALTSGRGVDLVLNHVAGSGGSPTGRSRRDRRSHRGHNSEVPRAGVMNSVKAPAIVTRTGAVRFASGSTARLLSSLRAKR